MRTIKHSFDAIILDKREVRVVALYDYYPPHEFIDLVSVFDKETSEEIVDKLTPEEEDELIEYACEFCGL